MMPLDSTNLFEGHMQQHLSIAMIISPASEQRLGKKLKRMEPWHNSTVVRSSRTRQTQLLHTTDPPAELELPLAHQGESGVEPSHYPTRQAYTCASPRERILGLRARIKGRGWRDNCFFGTRISADSFESMTVF